MIKKIAYLGVIGMLFLLVISCEKDFTDAGSSIINNSKFTTNSITFDVEMIQQSVDAVNAGNANATNLGASYLGEYLLGVYKKENAKTLQAGMVSQLVVPSLSTKDVIKKIANLKDGELISEPILDKVILKIPVQATVKGTNIKIDSLLGNPEKDFTLNVYKNLTYLNTLNPQNPTKKIEYLSNKKYDYNKKTSKLNKNSTINFGNLKKDTLFIFNRTLNNKTTFKDTLKVLNNNKTNPFIAIELDKDILKKEIFDKYINKEAKIATELSSQDAFNDYFRGIIIEVTGNDGAMIPLTVSKRILRPSIDFIHTSTITDKDGNPLKDDKLKYRVINRNDSFYFGGITNSIYNMSGNASLAKNIVLQGTAGASAIVKILEQDSDNNGISDLEELRKKNVIINDAVLTFDVNTSTNYTKIPKKLFLYKNEKNKSGEIIPTQLSDVFNEGQQIFNGNLYLKDNKPNHYLFRIRRHISEIVKGSINNSELILKVFNTTDFPRSVSDKIVKNYNWNPRSVSLLNNSTKEGKRGAKLTISYTEKK